MLSKNIVLPAFLLSLLIPGVAFGQVPYSLDVSPGEVYQAPGSPSCYTITVGGGQDMIVDLEFYYEYSGPMYGGAALDSNGQAQICVDGSNPIGLYEFTGIQNAYYPVGYTPVYASLYVQPAPPPLLSPVIYDLGPTGDNWDSIWISGADFQQASAVAVYSSDWSTYQTYWGAGFGYAPAMSVSGDGHFITLQLNDPGHLTDPALLASFGNAGVHVIAINEYQIGSQTVDLYSAWRDTQSPPPVISDAGSNCEDYYCIWMTGSFPLNATVDLRIHGQPEVLPNSYSDLSVTATGISLRLNPGVRHDFDVSGLDAWVVNPPLANSSNGYYVAPVDRAITGIIGGTDLYGQQYYITGWACAKTYAGSISVGVIIGGGGAGDPAFSGTANIASEPAVAAACNSTGSSYRFSIPIPHTITQFYGGQSIYVRGNSPFGLANLLIVNSGSFTVPTVDRSVTGFISGIVPDNQEYYLRGWACARTYSGSIDVHLYAVNSSGAGTFVTSATANQSSNAAATAACGTGGTSYGFSIQLSLAMRQQFGGEWIWVYAISPFGLEHLPIGNSGNLKFSPPGAMSSKEYIYIGDRLLAVDSTNLP